MKLPLKYQVLEALVYSCDCGGHPERPTYEVIYEKFPNMTATEANSIIAILRQEKLLGYPIEVSDKKIYCSVSSTAYAVIIGEKDKLEYRQDERKFQLRVARWGFVTGLFSGLLVPFIIKLLDFTLAIIKEILLSYK